MSVGNGMMGGRRGGSVSLAMIGASSNWHIPGSSTALTLTRPSSPATMHPRYPSKEQLSIRRVK